MKFTISKSDMEYGLGVVTGAVEKDRPLDYVGNVMIKASAASGSIELHATDMEVFASLRLTAEIGIDGSVVLPGIKLRDIVKECGPGDVVFASLDNFVTAIEGTTAQYELSGLDPVWYPAGSADDHSVILQFPAGKLSSCIGAVRHAVSKDEARRNICGIRFDLNESGRLTVAATDGHRLSLAGMDISEDCGPQCSAFTLPSKAADLLAKITHTIAAGRVTDQNRLWFESKSFTLCSAEIEGDYPDYRRVVPSGPGEVITVNTDLLIDAIEAACVVTDDKHRTINMEIGNERILLTALGPGNNSVARATVACMSDCDIKTKLSSRYLLQALKSIDSDEVFIKYFGETSPIMLIPADHRSWDERLEVIMPLRM